MSYYKNILHKETFTLKDFLNDLENALSKSSVEIGGGSDRLKQYATLLEQLERAQVECPSVKLNVNADLDLISVHCPDSLGQPRRLLLRVCSAGLRACDYDLPLLPALDGDFEDVTTAVIRFREALEECAEYLQMLASLDASCCVVDPIHPAPRDGFRRILIDDDLWCVVTLEPGVAEPRLQLLGPAKRVELLRRQLRPWDSSLSAPAALLHTLGLQSFPVRTVSAQEDVEGPECSVCLEARGPTGALPALVCGGYCHQHFHEHCLYQWLSSVASSVQRFGEIHGDCPSCSAPIYCPIPQEIT